MMPYRSVFLFRGCDVRTRFAFADTISKSISPCPLHSVGAVDCRSKLYCFTQILERCAEREARDISCIESQMRRGVFFERY